jgi:hypothetical protein
METTRCLYDDNLYFDGLTVDFGSILRRRIIHKSALNISLAVVVAACTHHDPFDDIMRQLLLHSESIDMLRWELSQSRRLCDGIRDDRCGTVRKLTRNSYTAVYEEIVCRADDDPQSFVFIIAVACLLILTLVSPLFAGIIRVQVNHPQGSAMLHLSWWG